MKIKIPTSVKTVGNTAVSVLIAAAVQALADAVAKKFSKRGTPEA